MASGSDIGMVRADTLGNDPTRTDRPRSSPSAACLLIRATCGGSAREAGGAADRPACSLPDVHVGASLGAGFADSALLEHQYRRGCPSGRESGGLAGCIRFAGPDETSHLYFLGLRGERHAAP